MPRERDAGWLQHVSDSPPHRILAHPVVVLRVKPPVAVVIHGTSTPRDRGGNNIDESLRGATVLAVDPDTPDGRALGLSNRTYFHRRAVEIVRNPTDVTVTGECPPELFLALRELAGFNA